MNKAEELLNWWHGVDSFDPPWPLLRGCLERWGEDADAPPEVKAILAYIDHVSFKRWGAAFVILHDMVHSEPEELERLTP